jgi:hypothetical protein
MKFFYSFAILFFSFSLVHAQPNPVISEPISVTDNSTEYGKHLPRIYAFADGTPVVFWSKAGSNAGLFMARLEGDSFGPVIQIPTGSLQPNIWSGGLGPAFAVYGDNMYVTIEIWGEAIYCIRSTNGGMTFDDPVEALVPPAGRAATLPTITTDLDGNPLIGCITTNFSEQDAQYEVVSSLDGGQTFGAPVIASLPAEGEEVCECCPSNLMVSAEGDIYVSFRNNNNNTRDIWITRSTDGGATYNEAADIDPTDWYLMGCPSNGPQSIDAGSSVLSVFFSSAQDWQKGVYLSTLDKANFEANTLTKLPFVNTNEGTQNFPRIAGNADTIGIIWHENTENFYTVAFAWSLTGPDGLVEQAILINTADNPQTYPDILYSQGKFHVVYEDQASQTPLYQVIDFTTTTGINPAESNIGRVKVWPNPARTGIQYDIPGGPARVDAMQIINLLGNVVMSFKGDEVTRVVNTSSLESGTYFLRIIGPDRQWTGRFIVE